MTHLRRRGWSASRASTRGGSRARCANGVRCGPPSRRWTSTGVPGRAGARPPGVWTGRSSPARGAACGRTKPASIVGPATRELGRVFRVVAYDFGIKRSILRRLAASGFEATVFPARTPAAEIAGRGPRRRVPLQRARRSGRDVVRRRVRPRAARRRSPCSASASATRSWAWRWAVARTRCGSVTEG